MNNSFDLIVIGAGSGGIAAAVRASKLNAKVLLVDKSVLGGTCVNVGCVPKKIMWFASHLNEMFEKAPHFGFEPKHPQLNWDLLIKKRDNYINRIHLSYQKTFSDNNITFAAGHAVLTKNNEVTVNETVYTSENILIATGGEPTIPRLPGAQHGITSDGFFELTKPPINVAVVGAGYIAVELAGILQGLGSKVHLCIRHNHMLREFDSFVSEQAESFLETQGVLIHKNFTSMMVENQPNGQKRLISDDEQQLQDLDCIIWAVGRKPNTQNLGLAELGVQIDDKGFIETDKDHNTHAKGIYAVGDITHHKALTPVAIRAGRRLSARLFGEKPLPLEDHLVPTILFSHPPIGTIGLTESQAKEQYGENNIHIYHSSFNPMFEAFMEKPTKFSVKLITQGKDEKIIGCHIAGLNADEMLQGFAVAIQMGATKQDFDNTIAIHPTSSEELVLLK